MPKPAWLKSSTSVSGAQMGSRAVRVYVCKGCGLWHERPPSNRAPPAQCMSCGRMDFYNFPSKTEAFRWAKLEQRQRAGDIDQLETQVAFVLLTIHERTGKPVKVADYVCDFRYRIIETGEIVIEDAKSPGMMDAGAKMKLRIMEASGRPVTVV